MKKVQAAVVRGKRVLVRFDGNVPLEKGVVSSEGMFRLKAVASTVAWLRKNGAEVVLVTHIGRPTKPISSLSTRVLLHPLSKILHTRILFTALPPQGAVVGGRVYICENIRFLKGEVESDKGFAQKYVKGCDVFVQDAFSVCHRRDSSMVHFPRLLPSYAGITLQKEIAALSRVTAASKILGFVAIVGGIKLETKLPLIESLLAKGATVLLGSALVIPWLQRNKSNERVIVPRDVRILEKKRVKNIVLRDAVQLSAPILDIGAATEKEYARHIARARVVLWNGPLGNNEDPRFAKGTRACIVACKKTKAKTIIGGGETVASLIASRATLYMDHVSTGGGALLTYISGGDMPGISSLS